MSFVKGFAEGFINERNRRLDEKKEIDQMTLRYRLEELSKQKSLRDAQKLKEEEQARLAKDFAASVNTPDFAPQALLELKAGMSVETLRERWDKKRYQRAKSDGITIKTKNPELAPDTSIPRREPTLNDIPIPDGVIPNTMGDRPLLGPEGDIPTKEQAAEDLINNPLDKFPEKPEAPVVSEKPGTVVKSGDAVYETTKPQEDAQETVQDTPQKSTAQSEETASGWIVLDEEVDEKIGTIEQATFDLQNAEQAGNAFKVAQAKRRIEILKDVAMDEAMRESRAKGLDTKNYIIVNTQNNKEVNRVPLRTDDDGELINAHTGEKFLLGPNQRKVYIDEDTLKYYRGFKETFAKQKIIYDASAQSAAEAFEVGDRVIARLEKNGNEFLGSDTSKALSIVQNISNEFSAALQAVQAQRENVDKAAKEGNQELYMQEISLLEKASQELITKGDGIRGNVLSDRNQQLALDRVLHDNDMLLLAYKAAAANGQVGKDLTMKEVELHMNLVGGGVKDSKKIKGMVVSHLVTIKSRTDKKLKDLNRAAEDLQSDLDFIPNITGERVGDKLTGTPQELYNRVEKIYQTLDRNTNQTPEVQPQVQKQGQVVPENDYSKVPEEDFESIYQKLPSGAEYIAPGETKVRRKK